MTATTGSIYTAASASTAWAADTYDDLQAPTPAALLHIISTSATRAALAPSGSSEIPNHMQLSGSDTAFLLFAARPNASHLDMQYICVKMSAHP